MMPMVPSTCRLPPSTLRLRLSFETPGMSACTVIPSAVSKMSTEGRSAAAGAAFTRDCLPSPVEDVCAVTSVAMVYLLDSTNRNLPRFRRLAPAHGDLHDAILVG